MTNLSKKKINKAATVKKIFEAAKGSIKDLEAFNKLMEDDEDIIIACSFWEVPVVWE
jgi:hypothetical protein